MGVAADYRRTRPVKTAPMPPDRTAIMKRDAENRFTLPDGGHKADPKSTFRCTGQTSNLALFLLAVWASRTGILRAAGVTESNRVPVTDGIVTRCRSYPRLATVKPRIEREDVRASQQRLAVPVTNEGK